MTHLSNHQGHPAHIHHDRIPSHLLRQQTNFLLPRLKYTAPIGYHTGNKNKSLFYMLVSFIALYWAWICNTDWILSFFKSVAPLLFFILFTSNIQAQQTISKQERFWVAGVCDGCKKEIEKAAKEVKGVQKAEWDLKTKLVTIDYNSAQTSPEALKKALVSTGRKVKVSK